MAIERNEKVFLSGTGRRESMVYLIIAVLMTLFAFLEIFSNMNGRFLWWTFVIILTVMLACRYGQGTDWYAYYLQFESLTTAGVKTMLAQISGWHGERGWYLLIYIIKNIGISFQGFIVIISLVMMVSTIKSIINYSPYRFASLLLLFPTFYMTYFTSALRQGVCLSIFLGFGIPLLLDICGREQRRESICKYYLLVILLAFVHRASLVLLVLPPAICFIRKSRRYKEIFLTGLILAIGGYSGAFSMVGGGIHGNI